VTRKLMISLFATLVLLFANPAFSKVTGLPDFTELVEDTGPAVVNIQVTQFGERARGVPDGMQGRQGQQGQPGQPGQQEIPEFFRRFFDVPEAPEGGGQDRRGAGSGFIFESDGYIITNHHVVDGADQIIVRMADRREFEAELIGSDPLSDVALLKIDAQDLPILKIGESKSLRPGEWVVAIGSPFNFDQSVTAGIVSAKGRSTNQQQYVPFIQTDVAINRGNSGGPLLNMNGEVVGINSWILSSGGGYMGLSFSIPIETAKRAVEQLREYGKVSRGLLGVQVGAVNREMAEAFGLERPVGALVNDVTDGSAAERAGILPGDVILAFDGEEIESSGDLPPIVGSNPPGTEAEVLVSRNGEKETFTVVLDALEADGDGNLLAASPAGGQSNVLGIVVESINDNRRRAMGDPEGGVIVSRIESDSAFRAGLRVGDVILTINNESIDGTDSFEGIVDELPVEKAVALRVMRDGITRYIAYSTAVEE
jgi:serine protease Do